MKVRKIIIALAVIGLTITGIYMTVSFLNKQKTIESGLVYCSYTVGGGMLGGYSSSTLKYEGDEYIYESRYAKTHNDRMVTKTYKAEKQDLEKISELIREYDLFAASKKGPSPFQVLDGDNTTASFRFADRKYFSVSDTQALSARDKEGMQKIYSALTECARGEAVVEIEKHEIAVILDGYHISYTLNECKATDGLLEILDTYAFERCDDFAQAIHLDAVLDVSDCEKVAVMHKGDLCYDPDKGLLMFVYEDCEYEAYRIGTMSDYYESSIDLIKDMENREYMIYLQK